MLLIAGTRPDHLSGLRSPDQATSKIFSKLWPSLVQPLMIWMRSRLAEVGSFTAQTTNVGAVPFKRRQVGAHGNAVRIGLVYPVPGVQDVVVVAPSAEEAHLDVRRR